MMFTGLRRRIYEEPLLNRLRMTVERLISDETRIKMTWRNRFGTELDLDNPVTFNEKLQWLKLYYRNPLQVQCSDKYAVRDFVTGRIGPEFLNQLYGVYDDANQIEFDRLPDEFVLKVTHGSEMNIFCRDRRTFDADKARRMLRAWLKMDYYWEGREWWYGKVRPRVVCEKFLHDETGDLRDFKFLCFNGTVGSVWVDIDRFTRHRRNFYDLDWNYRDVSVKYPTAPDVRIPRPSNLEQMVALASRLSEGFPHVRVDFYNLNDTQIIFGELTFCSGGGLEVFSSNEFAEELGSLITLPSWSR